MGVTAILAFAGAGEASAVEVPPAIQSVWHEDGFLEVRYNGELWYYTLPDAPYGSGRLVDTGWGGTSLVAIVAQNYFVEVKGDHLRLWNVDRSNGGFRVVGYRHMDTGWSNARLIAGVGLTTGAGFIEVNTRGELVLWAFEHRNGVPYIYFNGVLSGCCWGNVRQIAGHSNASKFVAIDTYGHLWDYELRDTSLGNGWVHGTWKMSGWGNVRLLGPGGRGPSFASVRYDGQLVQWKEVFYPPSNFNYGPYYKDYGWGNARLLG
ncbi:MAG TPA: hypothetical protein DGG94_04270 [Micromonosporaceae bacterium]|nr:hypothetical protein [Micromonosporaceae bacterium]HCU49015.1 hypothetical protein [Micromonosporaceae bacterium]